LSAKFFVFLSYFGIIINWRLLSAKSFSLWEKWIVVMSFCSSCHLSSGIRCLFLTFSFRFFLHGSSTSIQ
jgi:hypothetical protein